MIYLFSRLIIKFIYLIIYLCMYFIYLFMHLFTYDYLCTYLLISFLIIDLFILRLIINFMLLIYLLIYLSIIHVHIIQTGTLASIYVYTGTYFLFIKVEKIYPHLPSTQLFSMFTRRYRSRNVGKWICAEASL